MSPNAPAKPCQMSGCPGFRDGESKYCARHAPQFAQAEQDRRGTAAQRGYGSRWARYRTWYLVRNPICKTPGCGKFATDVDHITPVSGANDPLFWAGKNHQGLCHSCHSTKTAAKNGGFGNAK